MILVVFKRSASDGNVLSRCAGELFSNYDSHCCEGVLYKRTLDSFCCGKYIAYMSKKEMCVDEKVKQTLIRHVEKNNDDDDKHNQDDSLSTEEDNE